MNWDGTPMTRAQYEQALADAQHGLIVSDNGAGQDLLDVLEVIATHGSSDELVAEAEAAYAAQLEPVTFPE